MPPVVTSARAQNHEGVVRKALKRWLDAEYGAPPETIVIEELGLRHGLARVDLAVVNGCLHGFEIKSESDRLTRLPTQARIFSEVLDHVTLVAAERHIANALRMIPGWWGLLSASCSDKGVAFSEVRETRTNPAPDHVALAKLLWRHEALSFLNAVGHGEGFASKPRAAVYARLATVTTRKELTARIRECFLSRSDWRSGVRRRPCDG